MLRKFVLASIFILFLSPITGILEEYDRVDSHLTMALFHLKRLTEGSGQCGYHHKEFIRELKMGGYEIQYFDITEENMRFHVEHCVRKIIVKNLVHITLTADTSQEYIQEIERELAGAGLSSNNIDIGMESILTHIMIGMHFRYQQQ